MNALETLITRFPGGFISKPSDLAELVKLDRLHPVLVRCGGGRFTCAAQDVEHFYACVEKGGDYVRDISLPTGSAERARTWLPDCPVTPVASLPQISTAPSPADYMPAATTEAIRSGTPLDADRLARRAGQMFNENDCSGVFEGNQVTSDADSGL